jgi:hypothetical protein
MVEEDEEPHGVTVVPQPHYQTVKTRQGYE